MMPHRTEPEVRPQSRWPLLAIAALASACGYSADNPIGYCTAPASIAIEVDVTDSASGLARADSASGVLQSGRYTDSLWHAPPSPTLLLGGTRLGTYDVTITRPGYAPWTRSGVAVTQTGPCGNVLPVHLTARLQPGP